ncbi:host cell division inhibitor Icd-like protein [Escherichia coli]|nr:host cell division inhibitor Icd-like protein [Escherichia coli]ELJ1037573.1 host cell division inhibitor Icd-like protein [Escherichia coli O2]EGI4003728.1 host cell division inhibitor Icd-like protein [Escherichia coli]EGI4008699.1 host cell division inhibitor Icd-like protein [Escherichia coli]EGI4023464.1 host cell division inhibitor Icd-like protein [Escherichia coli]
MCWWVKTKSAPLPERSCEQLTYCAKNESVRGDYINRGRNDHSCRITGKTKATRYGGPLTQATRYPQRMSIANNATFTAGGQILSCSVITGTTALSRLGYAQLFFNSISQARRNISPSLLPQRFFFSKHDFKIKAATIRTIAQSAQFLSFGIFYSYGCRRDSSHHGADSNYSDSLALRRWRRLISPRMAVTINCASVSFSSLTKFISLKTSRGILAVFCCDLLLVVPVGITGLLTVRWRSVYVEKKIKKGLKCKSPKSSITLKGDLHLKDKAPQVSLPLAGLLTTNDNESIEVAMRNHTTHPQGRDSHNLNKYIWRFIALSTAQPRVITIEATSEQEARQQSPDGCVMVFAARIRQGVHHVQ